MATINALFEFASRILLSLERHFYTYLRIAIFVVMAWIGGLKVCQYEADGIVPFVSNSPFMSTYAFSIGLGLMICTIGTLVLLGIWLPRVGMLGGLLTFGMSIVTLSFLITTPECWVPNLADGNTYAHEGLPYFVGSHGFPMLSGAGRLVIKDIIMSAGGLLVAAEAARRFMATLRK